MSGALGSFTSLFGLGTEAAKRGTKKAAKEVLPTPGVPEIPAMGATPAPPTKTDNQVQESVGDTLADIRKRRGRVSTILTGAGGLGGGGPTVARTQLLGG